MTFRERLLAPLIGETFVCEVDEAPDAVAARLRTMLNRPPRRMFGLLKVSAEWIGVVAANEFAVWERRQHATRAEGRIRGRRGGSRVEAHIGLTRRTRTLVVVFFALFGVGAIALGLRPGGPGLALTLSVMAFGAIVLLSSFWSASMRQRAALRAFLNEALRAPGS